ncbi:MAG: hypothetical protein K0Q52_136 [Microbacterium sp.]|jgi:hypothetical protein|nr:hypothetical protein [Microbacterium sp.]
MTLILGVDPGGNTGVALAYYDATTPVQILDRWQVHNGVEGFIDWLESGVCEIPDEIVYEKFLYDEEADGADFVGIPIEGVLAWWARKIGARLIVQTRFSKGELVGYPPAAKTKAQRQRVRFDFLERHGMFKAGTENDDSNDAITHIVVSLRKRRHVPTMKRFWPPRPVAA